MVTEETNSTAGESDATMNQIQHAGTTESARRCYAEATEEACQTELERSRRRIFRNVHRRDPHLLGHSRRTSVNTAVIAPNCKAVVGKLGSRAFVRCHGRQSEVTFAAGSR
jgi:hypothetical protein